MAPCIDLIIFKLQGEMFDGMFFSELLLQTNVNEGMQLRQSAIKHTSFQFVI